MKAVANLTQRKVVNKASAESQQDGKKKEEFLEESSSRIEERLNKQETVENEGEDSTNNSEQSSITINNDDDVNKSDKNLDKLNENSSKDDEKLQNSNENENSISAMPATSKEDEFKAPSSLPRAETEAGKQSCKFRRPKVMPRLNISRPTAAGSSSTAIQTTPKEQASKTLFNLSENVKT